MDAVDRIIEQWHAAKPDLDVSAMAPVGRLSRVSHHFSRRMQETFARHGLNAAGFDVLATLRRTPAPHALSAGELMVSMMITSGTMTNRIDQLARTGHVSRKPDPADARRAVIKLTSKGMRLIDNIIAEHVETQSSLLIDLSKEERDELDRILRKLMDALETG